MKLAHITTISTGFTVREKPIFFPNGKYRLLLLGDISADGHIMAEAAIPVDANPAYAKFVLAHGDLIFRGRGAGIAVAVVDNQPANLVAAAPLIIIRPDLRKVDANYLVWFLGSRHALKHFAQHMSGSTIMGIGKRDLETLEVVLPDMETQRKIGALAILNKKEQELAKEHLRIRQDIINHQIEETLHYPKPIKKAGTK